MPVRLPHLACAVACCAAGSCPALADGPSRLVRIAHGTSVDGQRWTQKARADHGNLVVEMFLPTHGQDGGGIEDGPPTARWPMFVSRGSGFGREEDEYELDGSVLPKVVRLRVTTVRRTVVIRPHRPPRSATAKWPQLARYRFFVRFFDADGRPVKVDALDRSSHVLAAEPGVSQ
jgi:hypothetical protein